MTLCCINVALGDRSYPIRIGSDFGPLAALPGNGRRALLVSDDQVAPLYDAVCRAHLEQAGFQVTPVTVSAGEGSKSLREAERLYAAAAAAAVDRSGVIIALGGGVIGDLAGFVAATWLRGVSLIQVPTTLLAMVDSSVGGKTAVNIDAGKNLVGCFHQPSEVIINLETLRSLPDRERRAGLAEVIKYGLIFDADFYCRIADQAAALRDPASIPPADLVARCCKLKADVVALDERESGPRALLNFGHTFGHAVEAWAGYGRWLHGEAVALGMVFAAHLSLRRNLIKPSDVAGLETILDDLGLPIRLPGSEADWPDIRRRMQTDKKSAAGEPRFVLLEDIGRATAGHRVTETELLEVWHVVRD